MFVRRLRLSCGSSRGNRIGAFKIIQILRHAPAGAAPGRTDQQLEQIVADGWALREYYKWSERKSDTSGQIVPFNHTTSANKDNIFTKSLNLTSPTAGAPTATSTTPGGGPASNATPSSSASGTGAAGGFVDSDAGQMRYLRARISDIFQDLKKVLEERETFVTGVDGQPIAPAAAQAQVTAQQQRDGQTGWRVVACVTPFDSQGRPLAEYDQQALSSSSSDDINSDVSILYKNSKQDVVVVKMTCIMPYRMEEIAPYLADLRRRKEWDLKFHKGKLLELRQSQEYMPMANNSPHQLQHPTSLQYPEYQTDIVHMVFKSFSSPYKYRDVVCVRSFAQIEKTRAEYMREGFEKRQHTTLATLSTAEEKAAHDAAIHAKELEEPIFREGYFADGGMIFGTRSVIHPAGPEFKDNVRAVLFPTGYILTPLRDQTVDFHAPTHHPNPNSAGGGSSPVTSTSDPGAACKLVFLTQMDRESVLILSPDLLGETNELRQTFNNIKACLARDFGLRTLRPSPYTAQVRQYSGRPDPTSAPRGASIIAQDGLQHTPATYAHRHLPGSSVSANESGSDSSPIQRGAIGSTSGLPAIPERR